jgi:hypothetical protein
MSKETERFPADFPECLMHADTDTPVPEWEQITRSVEARNPYMIEQVSRIIAGTEDEEAARESWDLYPPCTKRSIALLVDKIYDEAWLDAVGQIKGAWDGGFFFWPCETARGTLGDVLDSKSETDGTYIECCFRNGLFAYLSGWNHSAWRRAWMETDAESAALHIGIFEDGSAEVHMEAFNPLFIKGAPAEDLVKIPLAGSYNHRQFLLHRQWEQAGYAAIARTSANFYHFMRGNVPLCF